MEELLSFEDLVDIAAEAIDNDTWTGSVICNETGVPIMVVFTDPEVLQLLASRFVPKETTKKPYVVH